MMKSPTFVSLLLSSAVLLAVAGCDAKKNEVTTAAAEHAQIAGPDASKEEACQHFLGEEPYDEERAAFLEENIQKFCPPGTEPYWKTKSQNDLALTQAPTGLEVDKGKCMAAILILSERLPSNVGSALVQFQREQAPRLKGIIERVGACVGANTESQEANANCARKLPKDDYEFYYGFSLIGSRRYMISQEDLLTLGIAMCGDLTLDSALR